MKKFHFVAVLVTLATLCGCSQAVEENGNVEVAKSELSISLPIGISRTAIDENGKASWVEGDKFALWAENRTGGLALNQAEFSMMYYWHSAKSAVFTSQANTLADGVYTYYAASPMPESANGFNATYTIPAVQNGSTFNGSYDIMVATPVEAEALSADKVNNLALDFHHKMHILKMMISEDNFRLGIAKLQLEFPSPVVGTVKVNTSNPTAAPTISNGSNILTIDAGYVASVGDTLYGVIVPATINGEVKLTAISKAGQKSEVRTFNISKEMKEGHITPMLLVIPQPYRKSVLQFSIGTNNLGEAIQKLYIVDNNGSTIATFNTNSSNTYEIVHEGDISNSNFMSYSGKTFTARFESAHAIVEQKFTMPTITAYTTVVVPALTVPYLLFEDFSEALSGEDHDAYSASGDNETGQYKGFLLNNYMSTTGWNAARFRLEEGKCARINVRYQSGAGVTERACGRLDTPSMKRLKSGANVTLKVTFDAGFYVPVGYSIWGSMDDSNSNKSFFMLGTHTNSENSAIDGTTQGNISSKCSVAYTSERFYSKFDGNAFGSSFPTMSYNISGCTPSTRIVWWSCTDQNSSAIGANSCYFMYIDNIRVSIAQ